MFRKFPILWLFVLPLICVALGIAFKIAVGPFWLGVNSDPSYIYFLQFLYILDHTPPWFVDHPGIPLQVLGAWLIKLGTLKPSSEPLLVQVVPHAEFYLHVVWGTLLAAYVVSLAALGVYAYRRLKDIHAALWLQAGSLILLTVRHNCGDTTIPIIANVNAEAMLMTVINLCSMVLVRLLTKPKGQGCFNDAVLWGIVCALGLAIKMTTLPWIVIALIVIEGGLARLIFVGVFAIAWVFFTLPAFASYPKMFGWISGLMFKTGSHGSGSNGIINPTVYFKSLWYVLQNYWLYFIFIMVSVLISVKAYLKDRWASDISGKILFAIALASLIEFAIIAKQPYLHYMAPLLGLCGVMMVIYYRRASAYPWFLQQGVWVLIFFILFQTASLVIYQQRLLAHNRQLMQFAAKVQAEHSNDVVCGYYRSSAPLFGLGFWNNMLTRRDYEAMLKIMYPNFYFLDYFARDFRDFTNRIVSLQELKEGGKRVFIYGTDYPENFLEPNLKVKKIGSANGEAVYEVLEQHSQQGKKYYDLAINLAKEGNYPDALKFALFAKSLGFRENIDELIFLLYNRAQQK